MAASERAVVEATLVVSTFMVSVELAAQQRADPQAEGEVLGLGELSSFNKEGLSSLKTGSVFLATRRVPDLVAQHRVVMEEMDLQWEKISLSVREAV
jgi:hypothetical protein